jgi:hypothetical protein
MPFSSRENGANGAGFGVNLQEMLHPNGRDRAMSGRQVTDGLFAVWGSVVGDAATKVHVQR